MRPRSNLIIKRLVIIASLVPALSYAELTCHLHPPGEKIFNDKSGKLIGPFNNMDECEKENQRVYKLKGRCHCTFSKFGSPLLPAYPEVEQAPNPIAPDPVIPGVLP
jgi:hypothetical protein